MTQDDEVNWGTKRVQLNDNEFAEASSIGPGPNGIWLDDDDDVESLETHTYSDDGLLTQVVGWSEGPDGQYDTKDDLIGYHRALVYDDDGFLVSETWALNPGNDGVFGTPTTCAGLNTCTCVPGPQGPVRIPQDDPGLPHLKMGRQ